jgi:hypothetical protein
LALSDTWLYQILGFIRYLALSDTWLYQIMTILVITDLHGHVQGLKNAMHKGFEIACQKNLVITHVVLLGDYMDNGPKVPELLDMLISIQNDKDRTYEFSPIMGNHDLMNLYNMNLGYNFGINPDRSSIDDFNNEWLHYFNEYSIKRFTPFQYNSSLKNIHYVESFLGIEASNTFKDKQYYDVSIPSSHQEFLLNLPFYHKIGNYIFVHACLNATDIDTQLSFLDKRNTSSIEFPHIPEQMKNKKRWNYIHPSKHIVVSGHCKLPDRKDFVSEKRISFHSGSCNGDYVHCALLDECADKITSANTIFFQVLTEEM